MITRVTIRNFKRIREAAIDLRDHIVFVGPNNSGKTTAIQALAVWRLALARWLEKREKSKSKATLRTGVSITRSDLMVLPLRDMRSLWHNCDVMDSESRKVRAEIFVEGSTGAKDWAFGMELEFQGSEQIYCRPMRVSPDSEDRMPVPKEARAVTVGHLPPLAGLQRIEEKANERSLKTRIAEGRAGDILRNLLYNVSEKSETDWEALKKHVADLFQVELLKPEWLSSGEILVEYHNGLRPAGKKATRIPSWMSAWEAADSTRSCSCWLFCTIRGVSFCSTTSPMRIWKLSARGMCTACCAALHKIGTPN